MSKYNTKVTRSNTVTNHQGGTGFVLSDEAQLVSLLATGLSKNYYEKESDRETRLIEIMNKIASKGSEAKYFLAQAIIYARSEMGQRTVTHRAAVEMAKLVSGEPWGARFFSKRDRKAKNGGIVYRLDDMLEIAAAYEHYNKTSKTPKLSNAMKKGFKRALESADAYELSKYQAKGSKVSLVDMVNLVHPKPKNSEMEEVFKKLMTEGLSQFNTVEDKNTSAGKEVAEKILSGEIKFEDKEVALAEAKAENFRELIDSGKIGYLALLRNLRNILSADSGLVDKAGAMLTNEVAIKKSLVFPHQIDLAVEAVGSAFNTVAGRKLMEYLDTAYETSTCNLSELGFDEHTAVVVDTSASMRGGYYSNTKGSNKSPIEKAMLIGATLAKGLNADFYHFATTCEAVSYNRRDSINSIKSKGVGLIGRVGHGTAFESIFSSLTQGYKRVFIISDLQGGDSIVRGSSYQAYLRNFNVSPYIYTVDLCGYGTTMFNPANRLIQLYGYGADIYEYVKKAEVDPEMVVKKIKAIEI